MLHIKAMFGYNFILYHGEVNFCGSFFWRELIFVDGEENRKNY